MKQVLTVVFSGFLLAISLFHLASAGQTNGLSPAELHLAAQIGFDTDVLQLVKEESRCQLHRLIGYDEDAYQIMANGIVITVPWSRSDQVLWSLRNKLKSKKYMAFETEINYALKADKIAVVKGTDQFEILRIMHTNGDDDAVSHEAVLEKLKQWEKRIRFEIVGAENDWIEIELRTMPQDLRAFAEEVYEFSPDTVDEGTGTLSELIKAISTTKRLIVWWN